MCLTYGLYLQIKFNAFFKKSNIFSNFLEGCIPRYSVSGEFLEISEILHAIQIEI